ncbi:MAG: DinB family protein [Acidobacteria bacterium]|nr:DinB family protein [Acidobacteriota bacterium]
MSNALEVFPATLEQHIDELAAARECLLAEISDGVDVKPSSGWSVGEVAYHVHLTEKTITGGLAATLSQGKREERRSDEHLKAEWEGIADRVPKRDNKIVAPEPLQPLNAPALSETVNLLKDSSKALADFLRTTTIDDLASISMPHPIHKDMLISGLGWLSLVARHDLRHLAQIKEVKQA